MTVLEHATIPPPSQWGEPLQPFVEQTNPLVEQYSLSKEQTREVVGNYFAQNPDLPPGRLVGIVVTGDQPIVTAARSFTRRIFEEAFQDNDSIYMADRYGPFHKDTTYLVTLDRERNQVAGVISVVGGANAEQLSVVRAYDKIGVTPEEIRSHHSIQDEERLWDIATFAIDKPYRASMGVNAMLFRMLVKEGLRQNIGHVFAMVDHHALRGLESVGIPFQAMAGRTETFPFDGSKETHAVVGNLPEFGKGVYNKFKELNEQTKSSAIFKLGIKKFLKKRGLARVAGMSALGLHGIDNQIVLPQ